MGHINIPIFIPHLGCPNQCIFCNQRYISGTFEFDESMVDKQIYDVISTVSSTDECEIAFFGGSFTGIDRSLMIRLLDIAQKYVNNGSVTAIRMSTRPDYINEEIICILKKYTISCVELGIQSMNDSVLNYLKRGHSSKDTINAIKLLKDNGFSFVGQMMIGLPTATLDDEIECAEFIAKNGAIGARIYPTLVFNCTELEILTKNGEYIPLELEEAVSRSANVLQILQNNGIPCIRIGLCDSDNLHSEKSFVAGPNHPSIGEMVKSKLFLKIIEEKLIDLIGKSIIIECPVGKVSQVIGNKKKNLKELKKKYGFENIKIIENDILTSYDIIIKKEG